MRRHFLYPTAIFGWLFVGGSCTLALNTNHLSDGQNDGGTTLADAMTGDVEPGTIPCGDEPCTANTTACCAVTTDASTVRYCERYDAATASSVCTSVDAGVQLEHAYVCAHPTDCASGRCCLQLATVTGVRRTYCAALPACAQREQTVCNTDRDCPNGVACALGSSAAALLVCGK